MVMPLRQKFSHQAIASKLKQRILELEQGMANVERKQHFGCILECCHIYIYTLYTCLSSFSDSSVISSWCFEDPGMSTDSMNLPCSKLPQLVAICKIDVESMLCQGGDISMGSRVCIFQYCLRTVCCML